MRSTIVIVHNELPPDAAPDELDVLVQAESVSRALMTLGYDTAVLPLGLDLGSFAESLRSLQPACVFNLVEGLDNDGRLIHVACSLYDHLHVPYTGASTEAMFTTSNKVLAKREMLRAGIPTPEWVVQGADPECPLPFPAPYIMKTLWEEASIGIDSGSVKTAPDLPGLMSLLEDRSRTLGRKCFAERFIDGREFNLSVLGGAGGPVVLPPAEIMFSFPDERLKILDYKAKWDEESIEYKSTVRTFDMADRDADLVRVLEKTALRCWKAFGLRGYARVDFRVDADGRPWVLEINANPCISPDSGFVAAAQKAGLGFTDVVSRILCDAFDGESS